MQLTINGESYDNLPEAMTVAELVSHLKLPLKNIAVERNKEIVPKSTYAKTVLGDKDQLEIIHFIGGG